MRFRCRRAASQAGRQAGRQAGNRMGRRSAPCSPPPWRVLSLPLSVSHFFQSSPRIPLSPHGALDVPASARRSYMRVCSGARESVPKTPL